MRELIDSNSPLELLGKLQPEDFLGEGFDLKPDGDWFCRFCEVDVEDVDKHLRQAKISAVGVCRLMTSHRCCRMRVVLDVSVPASRTLLV